ncbi:hypothetical protein ASPTUDRAFT_843929 [Aspergillus tubingensis CBS 134.48]|uniref:Uncharacterized protein n=1 Tax=Aspergillus tubingensis (strain CBS 134.48) TaxID=767770 RepID=A0A1L9MT82_ASPTC|nr:hypothetical protein ASPTUDRAFT_843929 [Aspergillus tubingensis CBS 134.48]
MTVSTWTLLQDSIPCTLPLWNFRHCVADRRPLPHLATGQGLLRSSDLFSGRRRNKDDRPATTSERAHRPDVLDAGTSGGAGPVHHRAVRLARTTPEPSSDPVLSPSRGWTMETTLIAHRQAHGWPPSMLLACDTRPSNLRLLSSCGHGGLEQPCWPPLWRQVSGEASQTASPRTRRRRTNSPPSSRKMENWPQAAEDGLGGKPEAGTRPTLVSWQPSSSSGCLVGVYLLRDAHRSWLSLSYPIRV